jgi:hypothetical protein
MFVVKRRWLKGMWKFLVGVKLKEDGWERCHDEVVGRDCWFRRRSDGWWPAALRPRQVVDKLVRAVLRAANSFPRIERVAQN